MEIKKKVIEMDPEKVIPATEIKEILELSDQLSNHMTGFLESINDRYDISLHAFIVMLNLSTDICMFNEITERTGMEGDGMSKVYEELVEKARKVYKKIM